MKGLSSVYIPLDWWTKVPSPPLRKHLPVDALAHLTLPLQEGLTRFPLLLQAPPPPSTKSLPHRAHEKDLLGPAVPTPETCSSKTGPPTPPHPHTTCSPPLSPHTILWAWGSSWQEGSTRCERRKATWPPTPHGSTRTQTPPLMVRREPRPDLPLIWNRTRDVATWHPPLPHPYNGPRPPTERSFLPGA